MDKDTGQTIPPELAESAHFKQQLIATGPNAADARDGVDVHGVEIPEDAHSRLEALGETQRAITLPVAVAGASLLKPATTAPQTQGVLMNASADPGAESESAAVSATKRGL